MSCPNLAAALRHLAENPGAHRASDVCSAVGMRPSTGRRILARLAAHRDPTTGERVVLAPEPAPGAPRLYQVHPSLAHLAQAWLARLDAELALARAAEEGAATAAQGGDAFRRFQASRLRKLVCGCGRILRASLQEAEGPPILCGACRQPFALTDLPTAAQETYQPDAADLDLSWADGLDADDCPF